VAPKKAKNAKKVINIAPAAAGLGVKERYDQEAIRWGKPARRLMASVLARACEDKGRFKGPLEEPRDKGGTHISIEIDEEIKNNLMQWAEDQESNQSLWANYILEKGLELKILKDIYN
jgi:hypothetical protein